MEKTKHVRRTDRISVKRKLDQYRVLVLRAAGKKYREIAAELGISIPSVARILAKPSPEK
jgi:hypothetical protein